MNGQSTNKGHRHGTGNDSRRSSTKHSKASKPKSAYASGLKETTAFSFLFVVNELQFDLDGRALTDQWGNTVPPLKAEAYNGEIVGTVFRYENGVISPAAGYTWHRPAMGHRGCIVRVNQAGVIDGFPAHYSTQTIFACSPLLPVIVTHEDASLGYSFFRRFCACDQRFDEPHCTTWFQLHFEHQNGVSFVNSYGSGYTYVAGKDASWIPSLVPSAYQNTGASSPPSEGLSGELPIILALMGFHSRAGRASDVFSNQKWHLGQWRGSSRAPTHLPKPGESPRGLLVQVCADNLVPGRQDNEENNLPEEEYRALLGYLEYSTILVRG
ncbi:hypothetical protein VTK56DRAFT_10178 [Thermocarpiscus australiensis]